jgi:hypothetical protein
MTTPESFSKTPVDEDPITARCTREILTPSPTLWNEVREDIYPIELHHFQDTEPFTEEEFEADFANPESIIVVTRDPETNRIIGLTYTQPAEQANAKYHPDRESLPKTAYILDTIIHPNYMGHHLVGPMVKVLEDTLIKAGYEYLERDAAVKNNYAANIKTAYGDRIVKEETHQSTWGDQVFYTIALLPQTDLPNSE